MLLSDISSFSLPLQCRPFSSIANHLCFERQLYYHAVGTPQEQDLLCYETPEEPKWMIGAEVSDDGNFVLITLSEGCDPVNRLFYADISSSKGSITG